MLGWLLNLGFAGGSAGPSVLVAGTVLVVWVVGETANVVPVKTVTVDAPGVVPVREAPAGVGVVPVREVTTEWPYVPVRKV